MAQHLHAARPHSDARSGADWRRGDQGAPPLVRGGNPGIHHWPGMCRRCFQLWRAERRWQPRGREVSAAWQRDVQSPAPDPQRDSLLMSARMVGRGARDNDAKACLRMALRCRRPRRGTRPPKAAEKFLATRRGKLPPANTELQALADRRCTAGACRRTLGAKPSAPHCVSVRSRDGPQSDIHQDRRRRCEAPYGQVAPYLGMGALQIPPAWVAQGPRGRAMGSTNNALPVAPIQSGQAVRPRALRKERAGAPAIHEDAKGQRGHDETWQ